MIQTDRFISSPEFPLSLPAKRQLANALLIGGIALVAMSSIALIYLAVTAAALTTTAFVAVSMSELLAITSLTGAGKAMIVFASLTFLGAFATYIGHSLKPRTIEKINGGC